MIFKIRTDVVASSTLLWVPASVSIQQCAMAAAVAASLVMFVVPPAAAQKQAEKKSPAQKATDFDRDGDRPRPSHSSQPTGKKQPVPFDGGPVDRQLIDEINSIRARLGGGVQSTLGGLAGGQLKPMSEKQLQAEFESELGRLIQTNSPQSFNARRNIVAGNSHNGPAGRQSNVEEPESHNRYHNFGSEPSPRRVLPGHLQALRNAARNLEDAAAELEEVQRYREADEFRAHAARLWQSARSLLAPSRDFGPERSNPAR